SLTCMVQIVQPGWYSGVNMLYSCSNIFICQIILSMTWFIQNNTNILIDSKNFCKIKKVIIYNKMWKNCCTILPMYCIWFLGMKFMGNNFPFCSGKNKPRFISLSHLPWFTKIFLTLGHRNFGNGLQVISGPIWVYQRGFPLSDFLLLK
ncbi:hypothetical protein ACJX0J_007519, partial [Zea mays]